MPLTRRNLLRRSALGAGLAATGNLAALLTSKPSLATGLGSPVAGAYGELIPDPAGLLDLPPGFSYTVVSRAGETMPNGKRLPDRFDGTGTFAGRDHSTYIVRNHEQYETATALGVPTQDAVTDPSFIYDAGTRVVNGATLYAANGGTSTVVIDKHGRKVDEYVSLAGTFSNCAGGVTPWGTWLSCEETEVKKGANGALKDHGFVFEVDPFDPANNRNPFPLVGLGRFAHEAAVIDPRTGEVYLTEDASNPNGLLYKCVPNNAKPGYGSLRDGGSLYALQALDQGVPVPDLSVYSVVGTTLRVGWLSVNDPLAAVTSTRKQFRWATSSPSLPVATRSRKLEGAWFSDGKAYIVCSFAAPSDGSLGRHDGQVWALDPLVGTLTLEVYFPYAGADGGGAEDSVADEPDNITASPYGGLILAEDSAGGQNILAVAPDGSTSLLARNRRDIVKPTAEGISEFTGVVFSPDGKTLFFHSQEPGITYAVTGPFARLNPAPGVVMPGGGPPPRGPPPPGIAVRAGPRRARARAGCPVLLGWLPHVRREPDLRARVLRGAVPGRPAAADAPQGRTGPAQRVLRGPRPADDGALLHRALPRWRGHRPGARTLAARAAGAGVRRQHGRGALGDPPHGGTARLGLAGPSVTAAERRALTTPPRPGPGRGIGHKIRTPNGGRTNMPTYDYRCERCGAFQALRSIALRDAEARCPGCGAVAARILSGSPHVGGVRRTLAPPDPGAAGAYARMRHPASCRCCGGG